ncbi:MAG: hypothetical protein IKT71_06680 [Paludibacteraceae bacterium]|nr:hypothetical protein [Paludibacteraceae bacterium]
MIHRIGFLCILLFSALLLHAENASNIRVRQEGKSIIVTYDLSQKSVVRLLMASGSSESYIELKAVSGDIGKGVYSGKDRQIVWKPLDEHKKFVAKNVRFKVETQSAYEYYTQNAKIKTLVSGQLGYFVAPQLSYGAMIGQMYKGIGWYVSGRSNFQFNAPAELACDKQGYIDGERPFYTSNTSTTHYIINAGFMMDVLEKTTKNKFNTLGLYVGAGYGKRELQWETTDGLWVKYAPTSHTGFSGNIGVFGSLYGVTLNVGVSTINFKYMEIEAGIGFMF